MTPYILTDTRTGEILDLSPLAKKLPRRRISRPIQHSRSRRLKRLQRKPLEDALGLGLAAAVLAAALMTMTA